MNHDHFNDDQIQELIEKGAVMDASARKHLEICARCRQAAETYRRLFDDLVVEPERILPVDFTDRVMSALPEIHFRAEAIEADRPGLAELMFASLAVISLVLGVYFIGTFFPAGPFTGWAKTILNQGSGYLNGVSSYLARFGQVPLLAALTAAALLSVTGIDHLVKRYNRRAHLRLFVV